MSTHLTIEQTLASTAARTVEPELGKDYRNACESLPALLLQSGLLPTIAWMDASSQNAKDPIRLLSTHLKQHLVHLKLASDEAELMKRLYEASSAEYQTYFELALKAAVWQKRIAKAVIHKEKDKEA